MATFQCKEKIGAGKFGAVYRVTCGNEMHAEKAFNRLNVDPNCEHLSPCVFDAKFDQLKFLEHKCLVKYKYTYIDPDTQRFTLVMELCNKNLSIFLEQHSASPLPLEVELSIASDIAQALAYLHENSIAHGSLSSNSILMTSSNAIKVSDYGMSIFIPEYVNEDNRYMPKHGFRNSSKLVDIFSFGVLLVQIMTRKAPSREEWHVEEGEGQSYLLRRVSENDRDRTHLNTIQYAHPLKQIALHCLEDEEENRQTSADVAETLERLKREHVGHPAGASQNRVSLQQNQVPIISLMLVGDKHVGKTNIIKVYIGEWFGNFRTTVGKTYTFCCCNSLFLAHNFRM